MRGRYARPAAAARALYRRLDRRIASFRRASCLACPAGCGECCLSPEVEATVLEMLPLALHLRRRGLLESTLERLGRAEPPRRCLFYSPAPLGSFGGHCSVYSWRPLLCRLFGYAAVAGPEGRPQLAICGVMRAAIPDRTQAAAEAVRSGALTAPLMRDGSLAAYRIDPALGSIPLPINAALKQALERVGLEQGLRGETGCRRRGNRLQ
jgi:Fe-S-cluster containining protein